MKLLCRRRIHRLALVSALMPLGHVASAQADEPRPDGQSHLSTQATDRCLTVRGVRPVVRQGECDAASGFEIMRASSGDADLVRLRHHGSNLCLTHTEGRMPSATRCAEDDASQRWSMVAHGGEGGFQLRNTGSDTCLYMLDSKMGMSSCTHLHDHFVWRAAE